MSNDQYVIYMTMESFCYKRGPVFKIKKILKKKLKIFMHRIDSITFSRQSAILLHCPDSLYMTTNSLFYIGYCCPGYHVVSHETLSTFPSPLTASLFMLITLHKEFLDHVDLVLCNLSLQL